MKAVLMLTTLSTLTAYLSLYPSEATQNLSESHDDSEAAFAMLSRAPAKGEECGKSSVGSQNDDDDDDNMSRSATKHVPEFDELGGGETVIVRLRRVSKLDAALGAHPDIEKVTNLSDTTQIMTLLEELVSEDVTPAREAQAAIVGDNTVKKKIEKKEKQLNLVFRIQMYRAEIERTIAQKKTLDDEIERYNRRLSDERRSLQKFEQEEAAEEGATRALKYHDVPEDIGTAVENRKAERKERKEATQNDKTECEAKIAKVQEKLAANMVKLRELQKQRDLSIAEHEEIQKTIAVLDQGLVMNAVKFKSISPQAAITSYRDYKETVGTSAIATDYDEHAHDWIKTPPPKTLFQRLLGLLPGK